MYKLNRVKRQFVNHVNKFLSDWCREKHTPSEVREMWETLEKRYGVSALIVGYPFKADDSTETWKVNYEVNGTTIENSLLVYSVYKGEGDGNRVEYNIYLS